MKKKINCWEYHNCGREENGLLSSILGVCPVARAASLNRINQGIYAGRSCWMVKNADCQFKSCSEINSCKDCPFYQRVQFEEEELVEYVTA